jgi:hypothetical protein
VSEPDTLQQIVRDLIDALHQQAKELERFVVLVEQVVGHLGEPPEFGVVASELSELANRAKKLTSPTPGAFR